MNYIIELANTHGGDYNYLIKLIDSFEDCIGYGMKFQPLSADTLATPSFEWYNVYQEIQFSKEQWVEIIQKAHKTKEVWLDIFDGFGVEVLKENHHNITGLKFQTSVLNNIEVVSKIEKLHLANGKKLILNIAAREVGEIEQVVYSFKQKFKPSEIILEFGFQSYPTELMDSGLSKIRSLKDKFKNKIVFADHIDGTSDNAIWLPVIAASLGVDYIEKHVMLDQNTKYDYFSSLTPERFKEMVNKVEEYISLLKEPFINKREIEYLNKTVMIPISLKDLYLGDLIDFENDIQFRRSNQSGLDIGELKRLQSNFHCISDEVKIGETFNRENFKKANIATIVACRLKSSRLKEKALKKIGKLSSVEYCMKSVLKFDNVNQTILATSTNEQDAELENYTYSDAVYFHRGHPDDVIDRYLKVCDNLRIDVVIRVTADCPFLDNEICQILLKKHFESGADYTTAREAAVGTNIEIINVTALKKVKEYFPFAEYSEYMTWYFQNNPEYFKLQFVDLPEDLIRDYRLTLDHQEDLDLFNLIYNELYNQNQNFGLRDIFQLLDQNPSYSKINEHISLTYKTDQNLIDKLNEITKIK